MRKIISFLALLVIAFALPHRAVAWNFSGNTDPSAINLYLDDPIKQSVPMTFANSQWTAEFTATKDDHPFKINIPSNNAWYGYDNGKVSANATGWTEIWTNSNTGKFHFTDLTAGVTYKVTLTGKSNVSCNMKIEPATQQATSWDFRTNTKPTAVTIHMKQDNVDHELTFSSGVWSGTFVISSAESNGYVNYYINATDDAGSITKFGNDKGTSDLGAWSSVTSCNDAYSKENYQGGITAGKKYKVEVTSDATNEYKVRFTEAAVAPWDFRTNTKPTAVTMHMKQDNVDHELTFSSGVWSGTFVINSAESNGYVNYYINATDDAGSITKFGNDKGTSDLGAWSSVTSCNDAYSKESYQGNITAGKKYKVEVTADDVNQYKVRFTEAVAAPWDFSGNTRPSSVKATSVTGADATELTFNYDGTQQEYKWISPKFKATAASIAFKLELKDGSETLILGKDITGDLGSEVAGTTSDGNSGTYKEGNLTVGKYYQIEIAAVKDNMFKYKVVEVTPDPVPYPTLYMYDTTPKQIASATSDNGIYTFNYNFEASTMFLLSTTGGLTEWDGNNGLNNDRYSPSVDTNLPGSSSFDKSDKNGKIWKVSADNLGNYTITVDWNAQTLTAVKKVPETTFYIYNNDPWATKIQTCTTTNGVYQFTRDFAENEKFIISTKDATTDYNGLKNEIYTHATGETILQQGVASEFSNTNDGCWTIDEAGTYTITIDWNAQTLTATWTSGPVPYPTLYMYRTDHYNVEQIALATSTDGTYTFNYNFTADTWFVLSTTGGQTDWNGINPTRYSPTGEDVPLPVSDNLFGHTAGGNDSKSWKVEGEANYGDYTITVDWNDKKLTAVKKAGVPENVYLPLSSLDFEGGKKHYFLVGERQGEWHLQPEWEFTVVEDDVNGDKLVLENRFMYNGTFAVAEVDNYNDYVYHKYTYYGDNTVFNSTNLTSGNISGNATRYAVTKGKDQILKHNEGKNVFWSDIDGENQYWEGIGTLMSRIEVTLTAGVPQTVTLTPADAKTTNENRLFTLVGDKIYNQNNCNSKNDGVTTTLYSRGQSHRDGWQEGWIQYDRNTGKAYVDGNGEYLYHTSFTPDYMMNNPALFNMALPNDGGEFSYSSQETQFVEWSKLPNLDTDPYKSFYEAFSGKETIANNDAIKQKEASGTDMGYDFTVKVENNDPATTPTADWDCYVVRDMWIAGEIKFWTGWGGNSQKTYGSNTGATWHGMNGGPNAGVGDRKVVQGFDITSGTAATLYKNGKNIGDCNYLIGDGKTPAYFNRVVLWINNTDGVGKSYIQFIQESAGPAIQAQVATNTDAEPDKNNWLKYNWYLNAAQNDTDNNRQVVGYEITRYRMDNGVEVFDGYPEGGYVSVADKTAETIHVSDLLKGSGTMPAWTTFTDKSAVSNLGFTPGLYRYKITITLDSEGGATKTATSNQVAIYSDEAVTLQPMALQLVKLSEEGKAALGTNNEYLTYSPSNNATFYAMNLAEETIELEGVIPNAINSKVAYPTGTIDEIPGATALTFLNNNPDKYWWTSDYYVRCLDYDVYKAELQKQVNAGLIQAVPVPTVEMWETFGGDQIYRGVAKPLTHNGHNYYSLVMKRGGNVAQGTIITDLTYSTKIADEAMPLVYNSSATSVIDPVLPQPYGLTYSYDYIRETVPVTYEGKQWAKVTVPSGHWDNASTATTPVYVKLDDNFRPDRLDLNVKFNRPNVVEEIYNKYDIVYGVSLGVKGGGSNLMFTAVDGESTSENFNKPYTITVNGVNPENGNVHVFNFATTTYEPNATASAAYSELGRNNGTFGAAPSVDTKHTIRVNTGTGFEELYLGMIERNNSTWDWMYKGHKNFVDADDQLEGSTDTQCTTVPEAIKPLYYLVELKDGSSSKTTTYEYLVPHIANHHPGNTYDFHNSYKYLLDDSDPLIGTYVAKDFDKGTTTTPTPTPTPTVYATAMYLFEQPYEAVSEATEGYNTVTIDSPAATLRRVNTAPGANPAAGNFGDLPDTGVVQDTAVVEDKTVNESTGMPAYAAVAGATYSKTPEGDMVTGVEDVLADGEGAEAVYYNLQGVRVDNPASAGVYIRVQGKNVSKVVVK